MTRSILITGATGKQGGALIRTLLEADADFELLAVTRDANSESAKRLAKKSPKIKLVEGNLDNPAGIFENASAVSSLPIWGVYSVQVPVPGGKDDKEEVQGKALVTAALEKNVEYFVYSSVDRGGDASFDNPTNIPHFISKHNIEHHLIDSTKGTDMKWSVFRPVAFMDNHTPNFFGKVFATCWKMVLKGKPLQVIAVSDIGYFGAQAFLNPEKYQSKFTSLAGDELTFDELAKVFQAKTGKPVPTTFQLLCSALLWMVKDMGYMFRWFYTDGYKADIAKLKREYPGLKNYATWLDTDSAFTK
ncbi:uncharacterized protein V1510DRAFT_447135, partial [Dipodascopsis tothii]|uniref:uncharacterized protein n=1 Tax=Dipodascopsis tothii TaxID=44089 RepID=UPI0034CEF59B